MHGYIKSTIEVEQRPITDLSSIAEDWRALITRAIEPNVFYEPAFALAAARVFGTGVHAFLVWSGRDLIGLFPARMIRRYGVSPRLSAGWLHPYALLGTPLVDRERAEAVIAAWLGHMARDARLPDLVLLPTLTVGGAFSAALDRVLDHRRARRIDLGTHLRALLAPGPDRANYLARSMGAKHRKELPRRRRRLAEVGTVAHEVATEKQHVLASLEEFFVLEARGWKGQAGTAASQREAHRRFFREALAGLSEEGKARVDTLRVDGQTIATTIALRSGDAMFGWKMAYDEGFGRYSPGAQLLLDLSEAALADETVTRVDSCAAPNHPMINHLWCDRHAVADRLLSVGNAGIAFTAARTLETFGRAAIDGAKVVRNRLRR